MSLLRLPQRLRAARSSLEERGSSGTGAQGAPSGNPATETSPVREVPAMRFVRATGAYTINRYDRPEGDQTLAVRAGDLVPADHWAVVECTNPGWFVDTDATPEVSREP